MKGLVAVDFITEKKMRLSLAASLAMVAIVATMALGCAGPRAEKHALWPAIKLAASGVIDDARKGVTVAPPPNEAAFAAVDGFEAAVSEEDGPQAGQHWVTVGPLAYVGINVRVADGEIGDTVAESLRERVARMDEAIQAVSGPAQQ